MKSRGGESLALAGGNWLGECRAERLREWNCDLIVPMPMHWRRRLTRGLNPPELIAERVASSLRLPVARRLLRLRRKPRKQGTLTTLQRFRNVRDVFRVSTTYALNGVRLLLLDDVMTTGATANEAARTLLRHGAERVDVAVIARGIGVA